MYQGEISKLEGQEEIQDNTLEKISQALDVSIDFLKEFQPDSVMNSYNQYESKIEITSAENSKDNILQQGEQNITNHYYPLDTVKELYERLLQEKDKEIATLKEKLK